MVSLQWLSGQALNPGHLYIHSPSASNPTGWRLTTLPGLQPHPLAAIHTYAALTTPIHSYPPSHSWTLFHSEVSVVGQ